MTLKEAPQEPQVLEVWITKYALTRGIYKATVTLKDNSVLREKTGLGSFSYYTLGRDAFRTKEEAVLKVQATARHKIASLEKQLQTLKALAVQPKVIE